MSAIIMNSFAIAKLMYLYMFVNSLASSVLRAYEWIILFVNVLKTFSALFALSLSKVPIIVGISFNSSSENPWAILSWQKAKKKSFPTLNFVFFSMNLLRYSVVPGVTVL